MQQLILARSYQIAIVFWPTSVQVFGSFTRVMSVLGLSKGLFSRGSGPGLGQIGDSFSGADPGQKLEMRSVHCSGMQTFLL